ncbi:polycomb group RING finger protein 1 isoform X2 [Erinaceus europaeus]|nr:polycomb group RING finger protein 1 isoform X2 [Erinaceus europaeus]
MRLRNQLQSVYKMDPLRNEEEVRVKIKDLNEHIVCCLCAGYFVDATTITECLHTFCKSCIVKYLQTSKYCPMCNIKIHETQPLLNLKLDRVMQDIVYKLVPGLQDSEEKRIREFYQSRGLDRVTQPSGEEPALSNLGLPFSSFDHSKAHYYRYDEQLSLCLERLSSGKDKNKSILQNKYVRCSVRAEVRHLRRVLCHRLMLNPQHVQLLFDNEVLPDHMTMKQIWLSRWFGKAPDRDVRCFWEAPGDRDQSPHWPGHHVHPNQAAEQRTCDRGPAQGQVQIPWTPEDPHLQEVGLHQV